MRRLYEQLFFGFKRLNNLYIRKPSDFGQISSTLFNDDTEK